MGPLLAAAAAHRVRSASGSGSVGYPLADWTADAPPGLSVCRFTRARRAVRRSRRGWRRSSRPERGATRRSATCPSESAWFLLNAERAGVLQVGPLQQPAIAHAIEL